MRDARGRRGRWIAGSLLAVLLVGELASRILLPRPGLQRFPEEPSIVQHPQRGYAYAPNRAGFTNSLGLRDEPLASGERVHILAVGNSFTVGGGVRMTEAWPQQLGSLINAARGTHSQLRVLNAGIAAYSVAQIRLLTGELTVSLKPRIVVLGLLTSRYWRIRDPYVYFHGLAVRRSDTTHMQVIKGAMIYSPFGRRWARSLDFFMGRYFRFGSYLMRAAFALSATFQGLGDDARAEAATSRKVESDLNPLIQELDQIHQISSRAESRLVILLINEQGKDGRFSPLEYQYNRTILAYCAKRNIECVDPTPAFEQAAGGKPVLRLGMDHHWSALAHRIAAAEVLRHLQSASLLDPGEPAVVPSEPRSPGPAGDSPGLTSEATVPKAGARLPSA